VYIQYLWLISPIRPISPMQCFYRPYGNRFRYKRHPKVAEGLSKFEQESKTNID